MISGFRTGPRLSRRAVPVLVTAATLLTSSAAAAPQSAGASPVSTSSLTANDSLLTSGNPAGRPSLTAGRSMQTLLSGVRVLASASTGAGTNGMLGSDGTSVSVVCWTSGPAHNGNTIWYQISAPVTGYVAAFNIAAHFAPAAHVPHCLWPAFSDNFRALEANLRIRAAPTTTAAINGHLASIGSKVVIDCYVTGTLIFRDAVWYHAVSPAVGYVTGRFLNTGSDPAPGVPRC